MTDPSRPTAGLSFGRAAMSDSVTAAEAPYAKERDSRFELLRVIAMLLIVAHHFSVHSGVNYPALKNLTDLQLVNVLGAEFLALGGKVGVFIFGAITGYFLIAKSGRLTSLIRIVLLTSLYSGGFYIWALATGRAQYSAALTLQALLPPLSPFYWFITAYALLFLMAPLINPALRLMTKEQYLAVLIVFGVLWYLLPTLLCIAPLHRSLFFQNDFTALCYAYAAGAFMRRYPPTVAAAAAGVLLLASLVATVFWLIICEFHALPRSEVVIWWSWAADSNSLTVLGASLGVILLALRLPFFRSTAINRAAACMLGVYLIHDNYFFREFLWLDLLGVGRRLAEPLFLPWAVVIVVSVLIACTVLEYLRSCLLDPLITWALRPIEDWNASFAVLDACPSYSKSATPLN